MAGFADPIAGAGGNLLIPAIQSPDFSIADGTGWAIMKNGDAYFYNVTAEGDITTSTVIVEGSTGAVLIYSGTPAAGNLIVAIAGAAGTDIEDNAYIQGVQIGENASPQILLTPGTGGGASEISFTTPPLSLSNIANVAAGVVSDASVLLISGPAISTSGSEDWVQLSLYSNAGGGSAHMDFRYIATGGGVTVTATYDAGGWTFNTAVDIDSNLTVNETATVGALVVQDGATFESGATFEGASITVGNGTTADINLNPPIAVPADYPYDLDENTGSSWATGERSYINQLVNGLNALVAELQGRGIINS